MIDFVVFSNIFFIRIMPIISLGTTNWKRTFRAGMIM